jgi:D-glycero-beta-D-manno-heptose 1-phosphate adenylyltransferase
MNKAAIIRSKIYQREQLVRQTEVWKFLNKKIIFTNGCFDLLHRGHIDFLSKAADLGNKLIVGLNTDASVQRLGKGATRPIQDEESRAEILASLFFVDAVILFDEETPYELIKLVQPDVITKGGDYTPDTVVGSDLAKETVIIELLPGFSTTSIESKILKEGK